MIFVFAATKLPKEEKCVIGDAKSCAQNEEEKRKQDFLKKLCDQGDKDSCQKLKTSIKKY